VRERLFEEPLAQLLSPRLARVDGGGSWLYGAADVWVFTSSLKRTLPIIREFLASRAVPNSTQIQYKDNGSYYHDQFIDGEWRNSTLSTGNHMGFSLAA
jgi:hypothetical protein